MRGGAALVLLTAVLAASGPAFAAQAKYGPFASPLSRRTNLEYFRKNAALDFWALMPNYRGQENGHQCSAASFTMVLNAAREGQPLTSDDKLVTIDSLLEKYADDRYRDFMKSTFNPGKPGESVAALGAAFDRSNVGNKRLAEVLRIAIGKLGLETPRTRVEIVNVDRDHLDQSRKSFHDALVANEKSADDFMILSFMQNTLTSDPEPAAHVAPVGAYDAKKKLVLIMDPDREWYEPYWAPEDKVFEAVADPWADHEHPGWIYARIR